MRVQHLRREIEAGDDQHALERDALPDVAVHVVRDLVRQHDLDLVVRVLGEHRVRDEDPPRAAEPGERGVGLLRLLAEAPLVGAEHARAGALGQRRAAASRSASRSSGLTV